VAKHIWVTHEPVATGHNRTAVKERTTGPSHEGENLRACTAAEEQPTAEGVCKPRRQQNSAIRASRRRARVLTNTPARGWQGNRVRLKRRRWDRSQGAKHLQSLIQEGHRREQQKNCRRPMGERRGVVMPGGGRKKRSCSRKTEGK